MQQAKIKEKCFFCAQMKESGLRVLDTFICFSCEQKIAALSPEEDGYDFYCLQLKKLWGKTLPLRAEVEG